MFKVELVIDGKFVYFEDEEMSKELVELIDAVYGDYDELEYKLSLCYPVRKWDSSFKTYSEADERMYQLYDSLTNLFMDTDREVFYPLMIKKGHYFLYRILEV